MPAAQVHDLRLKRLGTSPGSHAYGHPTLDVFDRAGRHFYFVVMTYGTVPLGDNILRDGPNGNVIVVDSGNNRLQVFTPDGKRLVSASMDKRRSPSCRKMRRMPWRPSMTSWLPWWPARCDPRASRW